MISDSHNLSGGLPWPWFLALLLWAACGPTPGPAVQQRPLPAQRPSLRPGEPVPLDIVATRDFTVEPSGSSLEEMSRLAAARVPLVYTCGDCQREAKTAASKRVRTFQSWVQAQRRSARVKRPAALEKLYKQHNKVLGATLSRPVFVRLRAAPPDELFAAFSNMVREGVGPYLLEARGPVEEAFKGDNVILRVGKKGGKSWGDVKVKPEEVKELSQVRAELQRLASVHGAKLTKKVQGDLADIAGSGLAQTLIFDALRTNAARAEAVAEVRKTRLTFREGQVVLKKGEVFTLFHRQILRLMDSIRCQPCAGGLARCAAGDTQRLQVGGITYRSINATRDFNVDVGPGHLDVLKKQAEEAVPPVFVCDENLGSAREEKIGLLFDQARAQAARERWTKLRESLEKELKVSVILQLLMSFDGAPLERVRPVVLDLYSRAQSEPIISASPPPHLQPCTLRRISKTKSSEETASSCPVIPLVRLRLELSERAGRYSEGLAGLPEAAQKAAVELVQQLLVANTTHDRDETDRRRQQAASGVTASARQYREGDVVIKGGRRLTKEDLFVLERMFSVKCMPVLSRD